MTRKGPPGEPSLQAVLATAKAYWGDTPSGEVMAIRAARCVAHLEALGWTSSAPALCARPGSFPAQLLNALGRGAHGRDPLSPGSVQVYYAAFKRALKLSGCNPVGWVSAPKPPRTVKREPLANADFQRLLGWMGARGFSTTSDLAVLLSGTGLRIGVEGLREVALRLDPGDAFDVLQITGKGGHERAVPVVDDAARELLADNQRMACLRAVPYRTHLQRWNRAVRDLGIKSKLATPHSVRHRYATDAIALFGGNIKAVQDLLGHASPATTSRYLHVDLSEKAAVLLSGQTQTGETP